MMEQQQFIDAESQYTTDKDPISFRLIILMHLKKITQICCQEWHGGYWNERSTGNTYERYYVQNSREQFWNAVNVLYDITYPYFDEQMLKADKNIQKEISETKSKAEQEVGEDTKRLKAVYYKLRMRVMRKLFRELASFLKRKDYFKGKTLEE